MPGYFKRKIYRPVVRSIRKNPYSAAAGMAAAALLPAMAVALASNNPRNAYGIPVSGFERDSARLARLKGVPRSYADWPGYLPTFNAPSADFNRRFLPRASIAPQYLRPSYYRRPRRGFI